MTQTGNPYKRSSTGLSFTDYLQRKYKQLPSPALIVVGTIHETVVLTISIQGLPTRYNNCRLLSTYCLDLLLEETKLKDSLSDPLFTSYLERALTSQFIPPRDLLASLIKVLPTLEPKQEVSRYQ